jgi:hypothetical protein
MGGHTGYRALVRRVFIAGLCLLATSGVAQQLSLRARIDSTNYWIGDPITIHIDLRHSKGLTIQPLLADSADEFAVLGKSPLEPTSDSTSKMDVVVAKYDSGDAVIPPLPFLYFVPGDTAQHFVQTNQLRVTIHTVALDTTGQIKDVKPPFSIPISLEEILLYLAIAAAVAGLGYLGWRFWRKRKRVLAGEVYVPPARPAHVIAFEELAVLKEKKLWQQGLVKPYYSEVTEILRRYIENRFRQPALEETTDEILAGLRKNDFPEELVGTVDTVLRRADLVKFAKHQPGIPEHEEVMTAVHTVVDRTKAVALTPVPSASAPEAKNVSG